MSGETPFPPEYGGRGDAVAARRSRRAFKSIVLGCVFLTIALYIADNYLRYGSLERMLRSALRLEDPNSSRVYLRNAVRMDTGSREISVSKYLQALAEREEKDLVLDTYRQAFEVDKENPALAIRYGVMLFVEGRQKGGEATKLARDRFHDAAAQDEVNALPAYLEAATIPFVSDSRGDIGEALALIARTNNSSKQVTFPKPIWSATLPSSGKVYSNLRRRIVDECLTPIYDFTNRIILIAREEISKGQLQPWRSRIQTLDRMGERLVRSGDPGSLQAICGLRIQLAAIDLQKEMNEAERLTPDESLVARRIKLEDALDKLNAFESTRDSILLQEENKYRFFGPLWLGTILLVLVFWFVSVVCYTVLSPTDMQWSVAMTQVGRWSLVAGGAVMLVLICAFTAVLRGLPAESAAFPFVQNTWMALVFAGILFSVVHPFFAITSPGRLLSTPGVAGDGGESPVITAEIRQAYRRTLVTQIRRHAGLWFSLIVCAFCIWFLFHRLVLGLFPFYGPGLLAPGLAEREFQTVQEAIIPLLGGPGA